jgi:hypothetical protein
VLHCTDHRGPSVPIDTALVQRTIEVVNNLEQNQMTNINGNRDTKAQAYTHRVVDILSADRNVTVRYFKSQGAARRKANSLNAAYGSPHYTVRALETGVQS